MFKNSVVVIEIGSSKLSAIVASAGVNNTFNIHARAFVDYAGFFEGDFVEKTSLEDAVEALLGQIRSTYKKEIQKIYVGVPAEFSKVVTLSEKISFNRKQTIYQKDLNALSNQASEKINVDGMEILSINPISFVLDGDRKTREPLKLKASAITAEYSVILAQTNFIQTFNRIWSKFGISQVEYLSEPLCEALMVLEKEERERTCIVIDVGARTTSIAFVKGDGLTNLTSFSLGGSHITNDLSDACKISYADARNLKKEIVLSLKGGENDFYQFALISGRYVKIPMKFVNEVAMYRIDMIADTTNECIRLFAKEFVPYYPIYLCGAGLSKIRGGKDYFAKCINRNISYGVPPIPAMDKPESASLFGLVDYALKQSKRE